MCLYTRTGKIVTCFVITFIIYLSINYISNLINNKIIQENEENKEKSLHFFIDI